MNRETGSRCRTRPSRAVVLAVLAGTAVLTAACTAAPANPAGSASAAGPSSGTVDSPATGGSSDPGTSATSGGSTAYQKGIAYAQCMRAHGVPSFPDPLPNGGFELGPDVTGGVGGQVSPAYQSASQACASLEPAGALTPQKAEQDLSKLLKFSACMRSHGEPKFPDPVYDSSGVNLHIVGLDRNSPQFQDAWQTCMSLVPLAAGTGSGA
jgi:hypothetical protein